MKKYGIAAAGLLALMLSLGATQPLPPMIGGMPPDAGVLQAPTTTESPLPPDGEFSDLFGMPDDPGLPDLAEAPPAAETPQTGNDVPGMSAPGAMMARRQQNRQRMMANLIIEQRRKMADQRIKFIKDAGSLMADLAVKKAELAALWLDDSPNEDKIIAKSREIQQVQAQLQEKRLRNRIAMLKILTPEQRKQMPMRMGGMMRGMGGQQRMRRDWNQ